MKHIRRIETCRLSALLLNLSLTLGAREAIAQGVSQAVPLSPACIELNETVLAQASSGKFGAAETMLSVALASVGNRSEYLCAGLVFHKMSALMAGSGRIAEAERFAERSVKILAEHFPTDDPILLRPLQMLAATRFEQGEMEST
jgi:hypothetical protein